MRERAITQAFVFEEKYAFAWLRKLRSLLINLLTRAKGGSYRARARAYTRPLFSST
jgi:hypothetical protein